MRQSQLFTKTRKESPKDETSKNADLLIRGGFIHKEMAGVYDYLPLGFRVFKNIERLIRTEMNNVGGQEVYLSALQNKELWEKTDRWNSKEVWFKTELNGGGELGLGFTHEEPLTHLMTNFISSYKDVPCAVYQFQTKFRNELRAKSGIMRGREFVMKDMYTFARNKEEHEKLYEQLKNSYIEIFKKVGIGEITYPTKARGGTFSAYSDEFQTVTESGEDVIHVCTECQQAYNDEVKDEFDTCSCGSSSFEAKKTIEVGNIFDLGTKFSEAFSLTYKNEDGEEQHVHMGSYGIGLGRLMGAVAEVLSDDKGLVWPHTIAPFAVHLVRIGDEDEVVRSADEFYEAVMREGIEVLYDDRDKGAGEKFSDSDLIGIPLRVIVSSKTVASGEHEMVERSSGKITHINESSLVDTIQTYVGKN